MNRSLRAFRILWAGNRPLTAVGLSMLPLLVVSVAGVFLDPRTITGAPAWLKPAKFAISIAIYLLSLSWAYTFLTVWPTLLRIAAWGTALAMAVEILIIDGQAYRGTTSHFNVGSPFDGALFSTMGIAIAVLWICSLLITAALFRERFQDEGLGTAFRYGMLLTVLGAASGGAMIAPNASQTELMRHHGRPHQVGGHTVGAEDGGPGMVGTGWSTKAGDLRIPHFLGLHGLQVLLLLWSQLRRAGMGVKRQVRLLKLGALSYFAFYLILLAQALRAESIFSPSRETVLLLALWLALTAIAISWAAQKSHRALAA